MPLMSFDEEIVPCPASWPTHHIAQRPDPANSCSGSATASCRRSGRDRKVESDVTGASERKGEGE